MSLTTDTAWDTAATSPALGALYLIELFFTTGTLRVTSWPLDVTILGYTWKGLGTVAELGEVKESEDGTYQKITLGLSQVRSSNLALALGAAETYQDRPMTIRVALVNANTYQIIGTPVLRFAGNMDLVRISRDASTNTGRILLDCISGAYNVRSSPAGLRMNQAQHSARHTGETGFRYVSDLIGKPQLWLSKAFQQIN